MQPLVSVIIPSYNHAHFLIHALESVFSQDFSNWELIVVDDGSKDNTAEVVSRCKDPRLHYLYQENRGLAGARNSGIRAATAEFIALLDADDMWYSNFLSQMVPWLKRYPQAAGVYCGYQYVNEQGQEVGRPSIRTVPPEKFHRVMMDQGNWLVPSAVLLRKKTVEAVGLFDETLGPVADTDLWIRMAQRYSFVGFPGALVKYRRHGANMSSDPTQMVNDQYKLTVKLSGPPEGDPASWPAEKRTTYARLYRSAARHYLSAGNIKTCVDYLEKLVWVSPEFIFTMRLWRGFARVHLPVEIRNEIGVLNWSRAEADIQQVLEEITARRNVTSILNKYLAKIRGHAYIALAQEAVEAGQPKMAVSWLKNAAQSNRSLVLARPYLGTTWRTVQLIFKGNRSDKNIPAESKS